MGKNPAVFQPMLGAFNDGQAAEEDEEEEQEPEPQPQQAAAAGKK